MVIRTVKKVKLILWEKMNESMKSSKLNVKMNISKEYNFYLIENLIYKRK